MNRLFVLARAVTYATLFIGLVLVYLPLQVLSAAGVARANVFGAPQVAGLALATLGGALAVWCILSFAIMGRGTPAPFDPPRRLITGGPYRFVRNPIYLGAGSALAGAALYNHSLPLLVYDCVFFILSHLLVVAYEEPTLAREFGQEYESYRRRAGRWVPGILR